MSRNDRIEGLERKVHKLDRKLVGVGEDWFGGGRIATGNDLDAIWDVLKGIDTRINNLEKELREEGLLACETCGR